MYNRLAQILRPLTLTPPRRCLSVKLHTAERLAALQTTPKLRELLDQEPDTILYSSFVDQLTPGWRQVSQNTRRERKRREQQLRANAQVKPFSLATQFMQPEAQQESVAAKIAAVEEGGVRGPVTAEEPAEMGAANSGQRDWMHDYEAFSANEEAGEDDDDSECGIYGTADPRIPVSRVPCHGCGALLQCAEPALPGYLPSEIFAGQSADYLHSVTCQRCHFLRHYNTAIDVTVPPAEYVRLISSIRDQFALAILLVDLTDLPGSIWPQIADIIGSKRPVFVVGNKVDLLPRDSPGHLRHVRDCLQQAVADAGVSSTNIRHTALISAHTGYGCEELITKLHNVWAYRGDVYLLGCTNVGKSTLFNALLRSDYCKSKAAPLIGRATASPWPGTTMRMLKFPIMRPNDWRMFVRTKRLLSQRGQLAAEAQLRRDQALETRRPEHATLIGHIDQTFRRTGVDVEVGDSFGMGASRRAFEERLNERDKEFRTSRWCFDTPGVVQPEQTLNLLTTEELLRTIPKRMITPRTFRLQCGQTLFLAGLGRVDLRAVRAGGEVEAERQEEAEPVIRVTVYASDRLPVLIVPTEAAQRVYSRFLGTDVLAVPCADEEDEPGSRLQRWPALEGRRMRVRGVGAERAACDIVLSSAGWIGVHGAIGAELEFQVWTPEGRGIARRSPALVPEGQRLSGSRIRGSLAHQNNRAFA